MSGHLVMRSRKRYDVDWDNPEVLTDGFGLYVRIARGLYHEVSRRGLRKGAICSDFQPRPRWRLAKRCSFEIPKDGLTCPRCGAYDTGYAETGVRSFCGVQSRKAAEFYGEAA